LLQCIVAKVFLHSITSSARARRAGGTPIDRAVRRFIANLNSVGFSNGNSLVSLPLTTSADINGAFTLAEKEQVTAVFFQPHDLTARLSGTIIDECNLRRPDFKGRQDSRSDTIT
jgi:hypothetical protein